MANDHSDREETHCCHSMDYSFWLAAKDILYAPYNRQDSTYHNLCYISSGTLAETTNSSMGPPWRIDPTTHHTMNKLQAGMVYLHVTMTINIVGLFWFPSHMYTHTKTNPVLQWYFWYFRLHLRTFGTVEWNSEDDFVFRRKLQELNVASFI